MNEYSLANSFLSSYTGISPQLLSMGPLNLNKDEVLTKTEKNKSKFNIFDSPTSIFNQKDGNKSLFNLPGSDFNTTGLIKDILDRKEEKERKDDDLDYERMTKYTTDVLDKASDISQEARNREFLREGIRSFANFPLIGAQANMQAAKNIADLTALNMGAMAAQNRVLETNPTKQRIAGKYFR
jgi:hypothetical protein